VDRVLPSGEVAAGDAPRRLTVAGADLLLVRLPDDRVVAFAATCPHQRTDLQGAAFCDGRVRCPLHLYEYDLETGENVVPTRDLDPVELRKAAPGYLRVHPIEERDGWIWMGEEPKPPPPSYEPPTAGPRPDPTDGVLRAAPGTTFEVRLRTTPRPGHLWRIEAAPGRATVRCVYARPWDREPAEVRSYEVVVEARYS
jgi:nitrite reductase/ring-hydroxylating ferredoxin subunit